MVGFWHNHSSLLRQESTQDLLEVKEPEKVLIGTHGNAHFSGKGKVEINFTLRHKLTLLNVYHVLEMKKNLMSTSLLSKKVDVANCVPCNASILYC